MTEMAEVIKLARSPNPNNSVVILHSLSIAPLTPECIQLKHALNQKPCIMGKTWESYQKFETSLKTN